MIFKLASEAKLFLKTSRLSLENAKKIQAQTGQLFVWRRLNDAPILLQQL